ncbi:copper transporter [Streptomonospora nanhaiensis]|uniref:copper transporter n=1 Tax=Streptomonospora nanhaiensis TaxID=1323731 RepID=UPI001C99B6C9|nr:copper transporter [Streptomonospora nanhaiensis]MBX9390667.1 copper transporter [Streptomonospora nanhaiensis]
MIDFRYHLVSIVAVFLALAVGIVLGTTMLQDPLLNALKDETSALREESDRLRSEKDVTERYGTGVDQLADATAEDALRDRLSGVGVAVVEAPGVHEDLRSGVVERIEQAGGEVAGRVVLTDAYLDPDQSAFVGELTDQLAAGADLPEGAAHTRAGSLLAHAVLVPEVTGTENPDGKDTTAFDAEAALAAFAEGGLVTVHGEPAQAARIAVVLAPSEPFAADTATAASSTAPGGTDAPTGNDIMLAVAGGLHEAAEAAVLVGGTTSVGPGGLVGRARAEQVPYSTVDSAGRASGDVAAALVVAAAAQGRTGAYGTAEGTDGFLPDPLPAPRAEEEAEPTDEADPAQDRKAAPRPRPDRDHPTG